MQEILLKIKDESKTDYLMDVLRTFDFVEVENYPLHGDKTENFSSAAGIWEGYDIDTKLIREKAWPRDSA